MISIQNGHISFSMQSQGEFEITPKLGLLPHGCFISVIWHLDCAQILNLTPDLVCVVKTSGYSKYSFFKSKQQFKNRKKVLFLP